MELVMDMFLEIEGYDELVKEEEILGQFGYTREM